MDQETAQAIQKLRQQAQAMPELVRLLAEYDRLVRLGTRTQAEAFDQGHYHGMQWALNGHHASRPANNPYKAKDGKSSQT